MAYDDDATVRTLCDTTGTALACTVLHNCASACKLFKRLQHESSLTQDDMKRRILGRYSIGDTKNRCIYEHTRLMAIYSNISSRQSPRPHSNACRPRLEGHPSGQTWQGVPCWPLASTSTPSRTLEPPL